MKRIISMLLAVMSVAALTACGQQKCKSGDDAAALRASMQEFLDSQKTEMERYQPAEVDRINSAIFETYGTCVVLCVSSDTDTARSVIKEYVK